MKSVDDARVPLLVGEHVARATYVARTRDVHIGWVRPWRKSSVRCHISLTGLPIFCEISAASSAASKNRCRPNEPPPCDDVHRHLALRQAELRARSSAGRRSAIFRHDQISALSARTSAIAQFGLERAVAGEREREVCARSSWSGAAPWAPPAASRRACSFAQHGRRRTCRPRCPAPHVTSSARTASMHWPNVSPRTATPVEIDHDVGDARHGA